MNRIHFTVLGNPRAQKRHRDRAYSKGKYDPSASDKGDFLALCRDNAPEKMIEGAVILRLVFWMPVPKSATKRFKVDVEDSDLIYDTYQDKAWALPRYVFNGVAHSKARFDIAGQIKFIIGKLKGVYWLDNSQVQIGWAYKIYSHKPRIELEIIW